MAETVNSAFMAQPAGSEDPSLGDDRIRAFKLAWKERLEKEHYLDLTEAGTQPRQGLHRAGSAVAFYQASAPTTRNGVTLGSTDAGLLWVNSDTKVLSVYSGTAWVPVGNIFVQTLTDSKTYSAGEIAESRLIILNNSTDAAVNITGAATVVGTKVIFIQTGAGVATVTFGTNRAFTLVRYTMSQMIWDGTNWTALATSHGRKIFGPGALAATDWLVPPGIRKITVTGVGQGGTGAAGLANSRGGGGGGSGAWCRNLELDVVDGETITVTLSTSAASTLVSALSGLNLSFGKGGNGSNATGGAGGTGSGGVSNGYAGGAAATGSNTDRGGGGGGGVGGTGSAGAAVGGAGSGGGSGGAAPSLNRAGKGGLGPFLSGGGSSGGSNQSHSGAGSGGGGGGGFGNSADYNIGCPAGFGGGGGGGGCGSTTAGLGGAGGEPFIVIEW